MRRSPAWRYVLLLALAILGAAALRDLARLGDTLPWHQLYDFQDFYCAGVALDQRADPYRYEPLHSCEHAVNHTEAYRRDPALAVPAPLPPYDFPPYMLLARLSFSVARTIDAMAIVLAVIASIFGLGLLSIPLDVAALALFFPAGYLLLSAGQVVPFALVTLVFCGVAMAHRRDAIAGILAALTLIEPHLGLPVCAAVLLWAPRTRIAVVLATLCLALLALLTAGPGGVIEYVLRVVPAQAAAETGYVYQYSLTYLLRSLGAAPAAALFAGELSYVAVLTFAVWLGGRLAEHLGRRELLAYLPAACSVFGGPYVHMVDLSFAIPAALVLATGLKGRLQDASAVALCLLAVPWIAVWITKKLFLASLFVVAVLLVRLEVTPAISIATFSAIAAAIYLFELVPPAAFPTIATKQPLPGDLAQEAWRERVAQLGGNTPAWFAIKLPTWAALAGMLAIALAALRTCVPQRKA